MTNDLGNKRIMAKNIQHYMDLNGKTRNDVCQDLNIKYTTLTDWLKANTYPRIDKIEQLAAYFGVKKKDLVEDPLYELAEQAYYHDKFNSLSLDEKKALLNGEMTEGYYLDSQTAKIAQEIVESKEMAMLFRAARDASPEDLETTYQMLLALKRKERHDDDPC